jgi:single-strand DNA-binding protein
MTITGTVEHVAEQVVNGTFTKRELVVNVAGQYPQSILIEFQQGNCALLETLQFGQHIDVEFDLRGRKWTNPEGVDKWFNTIVGYKITDKSNF